MCAFHPAIVIPTLVALAIHRTHPRTPSNGRPDTRRSAIVSKKTDVYGQARNELRSHCVTPCRRGGSSRRGRRSRGSSRSRGCCGRRCARRRRRRRRRGRGRSPRRSGPMMRDRVAALEAALDAARTPAGSRLLPRAERLDRAVVDDERAAGLELARDPFLARRDRIGLGRGTRCSARPRRSRRSGWSSWPLAITIVVPAAVAILPASILVCMPPRDSSEPAPPAIASISGVIRSTSGRMARVRVDLPAAPRRGRRCRRGGRGGRRPSWWRRGRRGGHCRRSGSRWSRPCRSR